MILSFQWQFFSCFRTMRIPNISLNLFDKNIAVLAYFKGSVIEKLTHKSYAINNLIFSIIQIRNAMPKQLNFKGSCRGVDIDCPNRLALYKLNEVVSIFRVRFLSLVDLRVIIVKRID